MPLARKNQHTHHRRTFSGQLEKITLLKRDDDQRQGTVRTEILYQCRRGSIQKTSQTLQADMIADHRCTWHIPRTELNRVGIFYLNPLDRIVDKYNRYWQPESTTVIDVKLFENHVDVECLRIDPPLVAA